MIESLNSEFVVLATCGERYSLCLTFHNELYEWGRGSYRKNNKERTLLSYIKPKKITIKTEKKIKIMKIVSGYGHNFALCKNGDLYSWGNWSNGAVCHR